MGASLCWAAVQKGYQVTAICGPTDVQLPSNIKVVRVTTATEMHSAALEAWKTGSIFIASAAVLDWDIQHPSSKKLKKDQGAPQFDLAKNPDILASVSHAIQSGQFVLGFAAETDDVVKNALNKLATKGCSAIFANDVSRSDQGFESEMNGGWWISSTQNPVEIKNCAKSELARTLLSLVESSFATESRESTRKSN
jgi:phosphopantothenoylcysteine decarboxylase/phosphopantothenate--cysteine ligase